MEILILVLFYYLAQNPDFSKSVQPLMEKLKDSEQMLNFLKDLSKFTQAFGNINPSMFTGNPQSQDTKAEKEDDTNKTSSEKEEKNPQSPTQGIADEFIQNILNSYLNKSGNG
jgi:hypothetical protein